MSDRLTEAQLIDRLKLVREHGSASAAAIATGIAPSAFKASVQAAKALGLTANSKISDPTVALKADLRIAERQAKTATAELETAKKLLGLFERAPEPPKWLERAYTKSAHPGIPMAMWSDWHWGEVVQEEEVGGVNKFNPEIAKTRLRKLVDKTIFLIDRMGKLDYPGIVVCLGGDMISGDIHEELQDTNADYIQQTLLELQDELAAALLRIADRFGKVFVPCVVGNHGRMTKKPRMKGRVYTSFEWNLYHQLKRHFASDARFRFLIPGETDAYFTVLGHRFLLTHGDSLGVKGGDGIIGALGPIARGTFKVGRSEAQIGRDFDTMVIGHWHTYIPRSEAVPVIVNGTLKGYDEFARLALRVPYSRPSQALWFVYEEHGIGEQWQVFLEKLHPRVSSGARGTEAF